MISCCRTVLVTALLLLLGAPLLGMYKVKSIALRPAAEYDHHLSFQNVVIGVLPAFSEALVLQLFDEKKIHRRKILPVLVVIENNNGFALRLHERDIYLVLPDGTQVSGLTPGAAFLSVVLKKPLSENPTQPGILLGKHKKNKMLEDFQHKHFGEKVIAPYGSDHGVIFFPLPEQRQGLRLYLPELENLTTGESLMFFEIDLQ